MWHGAVMVVGFTGLPHPDLLRHWGKMLMNQLNINLDQFTNPSLGGGGEPQPTISPEDAAHAAVMILVVAAITLLVLFFAPQIIFAFLYKANVFDKKGAIKENDQTMKFGKFHHGTFRCHENVNECLCACFCSTVRFADTYGSVGGSFWGSLCTFFGVNTLITVTASFIQAFLGGGGSATTTMAPFGGGNLNLAQSAGSSDSSGQIAQLIQMLLRGVFFGVIMRKGLRTKLGDPNPGANALNDCLGWGLWSCCALTQDSLEVEIALDMSFSCPCNVTPGRIGVPTVAAREVAPSDYTETLLGDAVVLEEGGR